MFGTLRPHEHLGSDKGSHKISGYSFLEMSGRGPHHSACDKCRLKKLRCSGQKTGCDRCKTSNTTCTYSGEGTTSRRRANKKNASISSVASRGSSKERQRRPKSDSVISAPGSSRTSSKPATPEAPEKVASRALTPASSSANTPSSFDHAPVYDGSMDMHMDAILKSSSLSPMSNLQQSEQFTSYSTMSNTFVDSSLLESSPDLCWDNSYSLMTEPESYMQEPLETCMLDPSLQKDASAFNYGVQFSKSSTNYTHPTPIASQFACTTFISFTPQLSPARQMSFA